MKPPTLFLIALLAVVAAAVAEPTRVSGVLSIMGVALILVGLGLNVVASRHFSERGIPIRPGSRSSHLATDGLFAISRNPMYLGMVSVLVGAAWALGSLVGLVVPALFVALMNRQFIRHEEAHLQAIFGDEYVDYARKVRRWI